jgi:hypothetical protein
MVVHVRSTWRTTSPAPADGAGVFCTQKLEYGVRIVEIEEKKILIKAMVYGQVEIELARQDFLKALNRHLSDEDGLVRNEDQALLEVWELVRDADLKCDGYEIELIRK